MSVLCQKTLSSSYICHHIGPFPSSPQWGSRGEKVQILLWNDTVNSTRTRLGSGHLEALRKLCEVPLPHHSLTLTCSQGYFCCTHLNTLTLLWINKEKAARFFFRAIRFLKAEMSHIWGGLSHFTQSNANKNCQMNPTLLRLIYFILPCVSSSLFHDLLSAFSWSQAIFDPCFSISDPIININTRGKLEEMWLYLLSARILIQESTSACALLWFQHLLEQEYC